MPVEIHGKRRAIFANAWTSRIQIAAGEALSPQVLPPDLGEILPEYPARQPPVPSSLHSPRRQAQPITRRNQARAALLRTAGETDAMSHPTDARGWPAGRTPTRLVRRAPACWVVASASASARPGEILNPEARGGGMACRCGGGGFALRCAVRCGARVVGWTGTTTTAWAQLSRSQGTAAAGWRKCAA